MTRRKKARSLPEVALVLIEWLDSRQPAPAWIHLADFDAGHLCKCASVGWLLYDGEDKKVLAPNMADVENEHNIQGSGIIQIPSSCVTKIVLLEEVE